MIELLDMLAALGTSKSKRFASTGDLSRMCFEPEGGGGRGLNVGGRALLRGSSRSVTPGAH